MMYKFNPFILVTHLLLQYIYHLQKRETRITERILFPVNKYLNNDAVDNGTAINQEEIRLFPYTYKWDWNIDNSIPLQEFISKQIELQKEKTQSIVVDKFKEDDPYNEHRENATFLVLCRNEEIFEMLETLQYLQDRFNSKYNYDYTFLNDKAFTFEFINLISSFIPQGRINFGQIPKEHWSYPSFINQTYSLEQRIKLENEGVVYGSSESYRHMSRFYSGFFYKHDLVKQYKYYWRVEPGVKFYCDLNYDLFRFMNVNKKKYGFVLSMFEYENTIPTLWAHFKNFINEHPNPNSGELIDFVQNDDDNKSYNLCHFWSNFEIADLSIFNNDYYESLFNYLDRTGGFFYERWGDAPIHSLAVSWFLNKKDLWWFEDLGYYHAPYLQCPQDVNIRIKNRCTCNPAEDFSFNFYSCTAHILNLIGYKK